MSTKYENRKKIALVTQPWDGVGMGSSIGIITCRTAQMLINEYKVFIYTKNGECKNIEKGKIEYRYVSLKADVFLIKILKLFEKYKILGKNKKPVFSLFLYHFFYAFKIALSIRKNKIDIVHIHNYSQFVDVIRQLNPKIKIILHMHCEWLSQLDKNMISKRISKIDLILGCSNYITKKVKDRFSSVAVKCHTIENGVDINLFTPGNSLEKKDDDEIKLLFVGRVSPEKGLHLLMEVFDRLYNERTSLKLDIVGPIKTVPYNLIVGLSDDSRIIELRRFYSKRDYKVELIDKLSPESKKAVTFHGQIESEKLASFYQNADIIVNPSLSESFGMSVIEAMACGKPVVTSRIGGMVEIIEKSKGGRLFNIGDSDEFYYELKKLVVNRKMQLELSSENRNYAKNHYSWEIIADKLKQYYSNV